MLIVAAQLGTGCALVLEVDAMSGQNNCSKTAQAKHIIDRLPIDALVAQTRASASFELPITSDPRN